MALKAIEMGIEHSVVRQTILKKMSSTGSGYSTVEALVMDCLQSPEEGTSNKTGEQSSAPLIR